MQIVAVRSISYNTRVLYCIVVLQTAFSQTLLQQKRNYLRLSRHVTIAARETNQAFYSTPHVFVFVSTCMSRSFATHRHSSMSARGHRGLRCVATILVTRIVQQTTVFLMRRALRIAKPSGDNLPRVTTLLEIDVLSLTRFFHVSKCFRMFSLLFI